MGIWSLHGHASHEWCDNECDKRINRKERNKIYYLIDASLIYLKVTHIKIQLKCWVALSFLSLYSNLLIFEEEKLKNLQDLVSCLHKSHVELYSLASGPLKASELFLKIDNGLTLLCKINTIKICPYVSKKPRIHGFFSPKHQT